MHFDRLFAYDDWANREEVARLRQIPAPPERAVQLLGHVIGAESVWLARLAETRPKMGVWPELTLEHCASELDQLHSAWSSVLPSLKLDSTIQYVNTKGEPFTSRIDDVLMHLILHGGYHRGQIATIVRGAGETPAYTDFIHCTRHGFI